MPRPFRRRELILGGRLPTVIHTTLVDNLVAWYDLEEAAGATRIDATGRGNNLTDVGTVGQAAGIIGNAALCNKTVGQRLNGGNQPDFQMTATDFTCAAWIYVTDTTVYNPILKKDTTSGSGREYALYESPGNPLVTNWYVWDSSNGIHNIGVITQGAPNAWHLLVCGYRSDTLVIWASMDNGTVSTVSMTNPVKSGTAAFTLGNDASGANASMAGRLDSVGVWKRTLTAAEITWLYNAGAGRRYSDL